LGFNNSKILNPKIMKKSSIKKGQIYTVKFPLMLRIIRITVIEVTKNEVKYLYTDKDQDVMDIFSFVSNCEMGYLRLVH